VASNDDDAKAAAEDTGADGDPRTEEEAAEEEAAERMAHEPEAAMAADLLDPGHHPATSFPTDSTLVRVLRKANFVAGLSEQIALFGLITVMVVVATVEAILEQMHGGFLWSFPVVRDSTFAIAMLGAAFATYQQRNLSMDLVSRRLSARGRMILRVLLAAVTIFVSFLFFKSGEHLRSQVSEEPTATLLVKTTVAMIPIGALLIIFHSAVQIVIEVDYLIRGKLAPEREKIGH
jgi:TRAP-type C4-dicarboxylate transport system permease small subunit